MPSSIFNVLGIDCLKKIKLFSPLFVLFRIIASDAALPVIRRTIGLQLQFAIKISDCFCNLSMPEVLLAAPVKHSRRKFSPAFAL